MSNRHASSRKHIRKLNQKRNSEKTKCVYILLSKTATIPSRMIKMWTKEPYAHASLAFDIELQEMYSFARKGIKNPFNCGFISEDITKGIFGRDKDTTCMVLRLWVTSAQYKQIVRNIDKFKREKSFYGYNYIGIVGVMCNRAIERRYNYFCSQFVYYVLEKSGIKLFDKKPGLVKPEDFRTGDGMEIIYEGRLHDYRQYLENYYPKNKDGSYIEDANKEYNYYLNAETDMKVEVATVFM